MDSAQNPSSRRRWMLGVGMAAAATGAGVAWWRTQPGAAALQAQDSFWAQRFDRPQGGELALASLRGRPLLVNFWATWCPPCVEELPMIEAFWREHAAKGIQVLALAVDQPSAVRRFLERQPLSFPIGLAGLQGSELAKTLGNHQGGLPFSVFFRKDASIYRQKLGQLSQNDLQDWLATVR
ncbi:MAG: TlpA disulfide reductase family protein [Limnohabitans sp.]